MAVDLASHHDALMVWFSLQLYRLLEAALGFFLLGISQVLLIDFEVIEPVLLNGDLRILSGILVMSTIDYLQIGPRILVHANIVKNAKDIPIDEVVLLGTNSCDIEQIVIADQPVSVDVHRNEAKKVNFLQGQRKQGLKVAHLRVVILDVLIIEKRGQFLAVVPAVVKLAHFVLVNPQFSDIVVPGQSREDDVHLVGLDELLSLFEEFLSLNAVDVQPEGADLAHGHPVSEGELARADHGLMQVMIGDMRGTDRIDQPNRMPKRSLVDDKASDSLIGFHLVLLVGLGLDPFSVGLDIHALVAIVRGLALRVFFLEGGGDVAKEGVAHLVPAEVLQELVQHARAALAITHRNNYYPNPQITNHHNPSHYQPESLHTLAAQSFITSQYFFITQFLFCQMRAKSAMVRKAVTIDNQMDHQTQKNKMLEQDRKLFLRQAEEIKQKYRQEIQKLKTENKKLKNIRDEFISNKRKKTALSKTAYNSSQDSFGNMDENYLRIMLDKEKHETKMKKNILFTLQDKLKEVEDNKLGYIEENPMMKTIRLLENRLDKVMIKYNEAQSIQQTYDQVVRRLKEERVGYDSQLAAIETCLKGKQHDFQELLLLAHDATHAKEAAFAQLKRFQQRRVTVQEMRTKYIGQKKQEVNKDIPAQNQNASRVQRSTYNNRPNNIFSTSYKHDQNYQRQELSDYQEAFRKLKEVTGVIDANEIIQKFKTQGLTTQSLEELQSNYTKKIDQLKREKEQLRQRLEQNKYVRDKDGNERRRLDEIEQDLAKTTNQYERTNLKYAKLSSELINIRAGVQHLKDLTLFYKIENPAKGDSLEDQLLNLNTKARMIYDVVKTDPNYMKYNYKASANAVQAMMKEQANYKHFRGSIEDQDEDQES